MFLKIIREIIQEKARDLELFASKNFDNFTIKRQKENESKTLFRSIWQFPVEQRRAEGKCGDGNIARYTYSVKFAQIDQSKFESVQSIFIWLYEFYTTKLFCSLIEESAG